MRCSVLFPSVPTFLSANSGHNAFALYPDDWLVHGWIDQRGCLGFFAIAPHHVYCCIIHPVFTWGIDLRLSKQQKISIPSYMTCKSIVASPTPNLKRCVRLAWQRTGVTKFLFMTVSHKGHKEIVSQSRPQSPRSFWPAEWIPAAGQ